MAKIEDRRLRIGEKVYTYAEIIEHAENMVHEHARNSVEQGLAITLLAVIRDMEGLDTT